MAAPYQVIARLRTQSAHPSPKHVPKALHVSKTHIGFGAAIRLESTSDDAIGAHHAYYVPEFDVKEGLAQALLETQTREYEQIGKPMLQEMVKCGRDMHIITQETCAEHDWKFRSPIGLFPDDDQFNYGLFKKLVEGLLLEASRIPGAHVEAFAHAPPAPHAYEVIDLVGITNEYEQELLELYRINMNIAKEQDEAIDAFFFPTASDVISCPGELTPRNVTPTITPAVTSNITPAVKTTTPVTPSATSTVTPAKPTQPVVSSVTPSPGHASATGRASRVPSHVTPRVTSRVTPGKVVSKSVTPLTPARTKAVTSSPLSSGKGLEICGTRFLKTPVTTFSSPSTSTSTSMLTSTSTSTFTSMSSLSPSTTSTSFAAAAAAAAAASSTLGSTVSATSTSASSTSASSTSASSTSASSTSASSAPRRPLSRHELESLKKLRFELLQRHLINPADAAERKSPIASSTRQSHGQSQGRYQTFFPRKTGPLASYPQELESILKEISERHRAGSLFHRDMDAHPEVGKIYPSLDLFEFKRNGWGFPLRMYSRHMHKVPCFVNRKKAEDPSLLHFFAGWEERYCQAYPIYSTHDARVFLDRIFFARPCGLSPNLDRRYSGRLGVTLVLRRPEDSCNSNNMSYTSSNNNASRLYVTRPLAGSFSSARTKSGTKPSAYKDLAAPPGPCPKTSSYVQQPYFSDPPEPDPEAYNAAGRELVGNSVRLHVHVGAPNLNGDEVQMFYCYNYLAENGINWIKRIKKNMQIATTEWLTKNFGANSSAFFLYKSLPSVYRRSNGASYGYEMAALKNALEDRVSPCSVILDLDPSPNSWYLFNTLGQSLNNGGEFMTRLPMSLLHRCVNQFSVLAAMNPPGKYAPPPSPSRDFDAYGVGIVAFNGEGSMRTCALKKYDAEGFAIKTNAVVDAADTANTITSTTTSATHAAATGAVSVASPSDGQESKHQSEQDLEECDNIHLDLSLKANAPSAPFHQYVEYDPSAATPAAVASQRARQPWTQRPLRARHTTIDPSVLPTIARMRHAVPQLQDAALDHRLLLDSAGMSELQTMQVWARFAHNALDHNLRIYSSVDVTNSNNLVDEHNPADTFFSLRHSRLY